MLCVWETAYPKLTSAVRFGTEKNVGFPPLNAIFDRAVTRVARGDGGAHPHTFVGLAIC
jgi:hypothetical protein